jgi:hypothetical protein
MKKTYRRLTDTLEQVTVEHNGQELTFLHGVIQMQTCGRFIPARSPIDGELKLIIEDYVFWVQNQKEIESWIFDHGSGITQTGMVLSFDNDRDRIMFMLRWA